VGVSLGGSVPFGVGDSLGIGVSVEEGVSVFFDDDLL
jgi:hypothetical protein